MWSKRFGNLCAAVALGLLFLAPVFAQNGAQFPPGSVFGNPTAGQRGGLVTTLLNLYDRIFNTSVRTANSSISPADCGKTVQVGNGSNTFFTISHSSSVVGYSTTCEINVKNGDTTRGKAVSGFPDGVTNGALILWPYGSFKIKVVNGAWAVTQPQGRVKLLTGTFNVYTNASLGSNTGTDGMAPGASAFANLQNAMYMACNEFDLNSFPQTLYKINFAAGTNDTQEVHYACAGQPGGQGGAFIQIACGAAGTLNVTNGDAFDVVTGATVAISGCTFQATGTVGGVRPASCLRADYGGRIFFGGGTFVVCAGAQIHAENGGFINLQSNYNINGNAAYHMKAVAGGIITTDTSSGIVATVGANVTFATAFADAESGGILRVPNWSASLGAFTVTGPRLNTSTGGVVDAGGPTASCMQGYFPGTTNGTTECYTYGSWTPTLIAATTPGTPTYNATNSIGTYEIVGRQVTVRFRVQLTNWTGAPAGNVQIGGLPFTATSTAQNFGTCVISQYTATTPATPSFGLTGTVAAGASVVTLFAATAAGSINLEASTIGTVTPNFIGECNYRTQ